MTGLANVLNIWRGKSFVVYGCTIMCAELLRGSWRPRSPCA